MATLQGPELKTKKILIQQPRSWIDRSAIEPIDRWSRIESISRHIYIYDTYIYNII